MTSKRRGSIILEAVTAVTLLSVAFIAVSHLLAVANRQSRQYQRRGLATREAANLLERCLAKPWDELNAEQLDALQLSAEAQRRLPQPRLRVDLQPADGPPAAKRIVVRIDWLNLAGQRGQPVRLAAWKHRRRSRDDNAE